MPHDYDLEPGWTDLAWEDETAYDDEDYPYVLEQGDGDYDVWDYPYTDLGTVDTRLGDVDLEADRDYYLGDTVD